MRISNNAYMVLVYALLVLAWLLMLVDQARAQDLSPVEREIVQSARKNGIDPTLALAIAEVESAMNPDAVGSLGEIGLFQLRPEFHPVVKGATRYNIDVATKYLAQLQRRCGHYGDAFFVCFNYGSARRLKYPRLFPYYLKVKAVQARRQSDSHVIARTD
jgi:soluble lytic murein transglycosylase-like protein